MDASKKKVTEKFISQDINGDTSTLTPSSLPPPQIVVRAKVSGTARTRTKSTVSAPPSIINNNASLRPQARATTPSTSAIAARARRSPSPSKLQPQPTLSKPVRAPLSKVVTSTLKPTVERSRHGSISSMLSVGPRLKEVSNSTSAPTTPLPRETPLYLPPAEPDANARPESCINLNSGSLRIKAKVSGLAKTKPSSSTPTPPSLSTVVSPPTPSSSLTPIPLPVTTRTGSVASRRLSITGALQHAQLVPLPTSPPASTLSFSSHSSTSASGATTHSFSTSSTPPLIKHARAESLSTMDDLSRHLRPQDEESEMSPSSPTEPSPFKRNLVARIRPGIHVSGGRAWASTASNGGWTDSNISGRWTSQDLNDGDLDQNEDHENNGDEEEARTPDQDEEDQDDDIRAEAKSNRKIADLEITTRSLLAINATLESTKVRQAREIRDLRRRLRETRLVLPPRTYRKLQETDPDPTSDADADPESEDDDHAEDEGFARLQALVESLLDAGRKALAVPAPSALQVAPPHHEGGPTVSKVEVLGWETGGKHGVAIGNRVLSPDEARDWAEGTDDENGEGEEQVDRNDTPLPPVVITESTGLDAGDT